MELLEPYLTNPVCWPALGIVGFGFYAMFGEFWTRWIGHFPGYAKHQPSQLDTWQNQRERDRRSASSD